MSPLPKTKRGYEYILVYQDRFTRWVEMVPIRRAADKIVLDEFVKCICFRFGAPEVLLTDNGTEFKNSVIDDFLIEKGIRHEIIPPYHRKANPVERVNRTIKQMVVYYLQEGHDRWNDHL